MYMLYTLIVEEHAEGYFVIFLVVRIIIDVAGIVHNTDDILHFLRHFIHTGFVMAVFVDWLKVTSSCFW